MDRQAVTIVLDGVGVGELPDAGDYSDEGSNSLGNVSRAVGGLHLPTLERLGLGIILPLEGVCETDEPSASWGRMAEVSPGKDSISGHWELMGCPLSERFPIYPKGFPPDVIEILEKKIGRAIIGNRPASGTQIIDELGGEHIRSGGLIVYTSADSVFQIAAHEDIISVRELYEICETAREILVRPNHVARVIARPFIGVPGNFSRSPRRRDFSLPPPGKTLLDLLSERGHRVVTVGKIHDLFARRGIGEAVEARGNDEAMKIAGGIPRSHTPFSFLFINLIDFDMLWGHRRDFKNYAGGLERFDTWLDGFLRILEPGTLVSITSDHGCDPTAGGSDHTREYVPILAKIVGQDRGVPLGTRNTFSDLAASLAEFFGFELKVGRSFLESII